MAPWIQVYSNVVTHEKTYALAEALHIPNYAAVGLMVSLWCWAAINAPDGDVTGYPARAIADAAGWEKKPQAFYQTLLEVKLLDAEEGNVTIRNWERYAELLMRYINGQKNKTNERVKRFRSKEKGGKNGNGNVSDTPCNAYT